MIVLGIDAADYRLAKRWDLENLLLDNHASLETFSHSLDTPSTIEVWPSIATGLSPEEHGLSVGSGDRLEWENPVLKLGSRITSHLPTEVRYQLGRPFRRASALESARIDESVSHLFETGYVRNWPGITPAREWGRASEWFGQVSRGELTDDEYVRREMGNDGQIIGWLEAQALSDVSLAGAHIHGLDHLGHVYAKRPEKLRNGYEIVDTLVGQLRELADELVIVSDHGMQQTLTDDPEPGVHSWHAMVSTTIDGELPDSVFDVRSWIEARLEGETRAENGAATIDAPTEHLEDLGYL
ncbi:alkaline phosphatase family protein [Natronococcus wangiae]|uniref:alkaline phosphatase family protein n=1 Tax=Natronococcus wangiae TaxID=3068275 RepID=UPI00273D55BA|nr:alkaline phosphatase family protein [Natronococcus sp. AD5]